MVGRRMSASEGKNNDHVRYQRMNDADIETEILIVYLRVDCQLRSGEFEAVDRDLAAIHVDTTPLVLLLAWLSITHPAKDHLPARAAFASAVKARCEREEPERIEELLRGLP